MRIAPVLLAILLSYTSSCFAGWLLDRASSDCSRANRLVESVFSEDRVEGYICKKQYALAISEITKAIEDKYSLHDRRELFWLRAELYEKLHNPELAKKDRAAGKAAGVGLGYAEIRPKNLTAPPGGLSNPQPWKAVDWPPSTPLPTVTSPLPPDQGKRIALVIGNSAYRTVTPLKNPEADSKMVAEEFRRLGFAEVIEKRDLSLNDLSSELKAFGDRALGADWAVVYYAGHGIEVGGINYVIPIDAELKTAAHVEEEAIPLDRVLSKVEGAKKLRLVILDACRDNPFAQRVASAAGGTRSVGRGLARVEPRGGVLVAYSARDGRLAQDGDGVNSPFAQALVQHLQEPGLEISLLFRKVADSVWTNTHGEQEPFTYGALPADALYFKMAE